MDAHAGDDGLDPAFPAVEVLSSESGSPVAPSRGRRVHRRSRLLAGIATVMALVVGGGAYAAWSVLNGGGTQPDQILPATTVAFVKLDLNPSAGQKLDLYRLLQKFPAATHLQSSDSDFSGWITRQLSQSVTTGGLNFAKDIKPWLGDRFAVALVPLRSKAGAQTPEPVVVLAETDQTAAAAAMNKLRALGDSSLGYAFTDGYVVVSPSLKSGAAAVVTAGHASPLSGNKQFQSDIASLNSDQVITAWMDAGRVGKLLQQGIAAALSGPFSATSSSGSGTSSAGSVSISGPAPTGYPKVNSNGSITLPDGTTITPPPGASVPPDAFSAGSAPGSGSGSGAVSGSGTGAVPGGPLSPLSAFGSLSPFAGSSFGSSWQGRWVLGVHATGNGIEIQVKTLGGTASVAVPPLGQLNEVAPDAFVVFAVSRPDRAVASAWQQAEQAGAVAALASEAKSSGVKLPADIENLVGSRLVVSVGGDVSAPAFLAVARSTDPAAGQAVLTKLFGASGLQLSSAVRDGQLFVGSSQGVADGPTSAGPTASSLFRDAVADPGQAQEIAFVDLGPVWSASANDSGGPSAAVQAELRHIAAVGLSSVTTGTTSTTTVRLIVR